MLSWTSAAEPSSDADILAKQVANAHARCAQLRADQMSFIQVHPTRVRTAQALPALACGHTHGSASERQTLGPERRCVSAAAACVQCRASSAASALLEHVASKQLEASVL